MTHRSSPTSSRPPPHTLLATRTDATSAGSATVGPGPSRIHSCPASRPSFDALPGREPATGARGNASGRAWSPGPRTTIKDAAPLGRDDRGQLATTFATLGYPMPAILYFDLGSPYVYLAVERLHRFDFGEVQFRPVSLGALFKLTDRSSWGLSPRRDLGMAEIDTRARAYGLPPMRWPEGWPGNYLRANRACIVAEAEGRPPE
jgi:hypothetical protein